MAQHLGFALVVLLGHRKELSIILLIHQVGLVLGGNVRHAVIAD